MTVGTLQLCIRKEHERFIVKKAFSSGAFKLGKAQFIEGIPLYYLMHIGGGYVSGDRYEQIITCEENAALYLTTQAATKVYKGLTPAIVETSIYLGENAHLSLLQDPLILYEHAKFHQSVNVALTNNSTFYYSEILTAGWSPQNEPFQYDELFSKLHLTFNNELFYVDRLFLQKGRQQSYLQFNAYSHYGNYLCIDTFDEEFYEWLEAFQSNYEQMGISTLDGRGFVCKLLGHRTQYIERAFQQLDEKIRTVKNRAKVTLRKY